MSAMNRREMIARRGTRQPLGVLGRKERTENEAIEAVLDCANGLTEAAFFEIISIASVQNGERAEMSISIFGREDGEPVDRVTVLWTWPADVQPKDGLMLSWREIRFRRRAA